MDFLLKIKHCYALFEESSDIHCIIIKGEVPRNTYKYHGFTALPIHGIDDPTFHHTFPVQDISWFSLPFLSMVALFHQFHLELYYRSMQFKTSVAPVNG